MYGYDQEVGSRKVQGEVGRAEVHQSQGNEQPEHESQAREQHTLGIGEWFLAEEALHAHEEAEHRGEEEHERTGARRQLAEAHGHGSEERCDDQEEHREEERVEEERLQKELDQKELDQEELRQEAHIESKERRDPRPEDSREAGKASEGRRYRGDSPGAGRRSRRDG